MINCTSENKSSLMQRCTVTLVLAFCSSQVHPAEPASMGLELTSTNSGAAYDSAAVYGETRIGMEEPRKAFSYRSDFLRVTGTKDSLFAQDFANEMQIRARRDARDDLHIEIQTSPNRVIRAFIPDSGTLRIRFVQAENGSLIPLENRDIDAFLWLFGQLEHLAPQQSDTAQSPLDKVVRLLALLAPIGPGHTLDIQTPVTPELYSSLCENIGETVTATFEIDGQIFTVDDVVGPCSEGVCLGRCGPGCNMPPSGHVQRFTQECFNHDVCCREGDVENCDRPWGNECGEEWLAAVVGFLFARDCNKVNGTWQVEIDGDWCFEGRCGTITGVDNVSFSRRLNQTGARIAGVSQNVRHDGRKPIYSLRFDNQSPPQVVSGTIRLPAYNGIDGCLGTPIGWGSAAVQSGTYACGVMFLSYSGTFPYGEGPPECAYAGDGSWDGTAEGLRE